MNLFCFRQCKNSIWFLREKCWNWNSTRRPCFWPDRRGLWERERRPWQSDASWAFRARRSAGIRIRERRARATAAESSPTSDREWNSRRCYTPIKIIQKKKEKQFFFISLVFNDFSSSLCSSNLSQMEWKRAHFYGWRKKKKKFLTDVKGEKECFTLSGLAAWS